MVIVSTHVIAYTLLYGYSQRRRHVVFWEPRFKDIVKMSENFQVKTDMCTVCTLLYYSPVGQLYLVCALNYFSH